MYRSYVPSAYVRYFELRQISSLGTARLGEDSSDDLVRSGRNLHAVQTTRCNRLHCVGRAGRSRWRGEGPRAVELDVARLTTCVRRRVSAAAQRWTGTASAISCLDLGRRAAVASVKSDSSGNCWTPHWLCGSVRRCQRSAQEKSLGGSLSFASALNVGRTSSPSRIRKSYGGAESQRRILKRRSQTERSSKIIRTTREGRAASSSDIPASGRSTRFAVGWIPTRS